MVSYKGFKTKCITMQAEDMGHCDIKIGDFVRADENGYVILAGVGKPFLGICLGLQILFESSEESPGVSGLSLLKGKVLRIPAAPGLKIPHIGWNSLEIKKDGGLFRSITGEPYVYFVHSYYLKAEEDVVTAAAQYGVEIHAAVQKNNLMACQFHPEKSGALGLKLLENFAVMTRGKGGV